MRTDKWGTRRAVSVKQALEITSHLSGSLNHSLRRTRTHQPAPRWSWGAEMVWDCFSVAPPGLLLIEADVDCESHTRPWKGHLGQVKTSQPPSSTSTPLIRFLPNALLLRLLCVVVCHLVLCWWNAIVLRNRERGGDYHGLFVTVGIGEADVGGKGGWLVAFKSD